MQLLKLGKPATISRDIFWFAPCQKISAKIGEEGGFEKWFIQESP